MFSTFPVNVFEVSATRSSLRYILTHSFGLKLRPAMVTASRLPSADRPVTLAQKWSSHSGGAAVSDAVVQTQIPSMESSSRRDAPLLSYAEAPSMLKCTGPTSCHLDRDHFGLFPYEAPATAAVHTCLCQLQPRWLMPWKCLQSSSSFAFMLRATFVHVSAVSSF